MWAFIKYKFIFKDVLLEEERDHDIQSWMMAQCYELMQSRPAERPADASTDLKEIKELNRRYCKLLLNNLIIPYRIRTMDGCSFLQNIEIGQETARIEGRAYWSFLWKRLKESNLKIWTDHWFSFVFIKSIPNSKNKIYIFRVALNLVILHCFSYEFYFPNFSKNFYCQITVFTVQ